MAYGIMSKAFQSSHTLCLMNLPQKEKKEMHKKLWYITKLAFYTLTEKLININDRNAFFDCIIIENSSKPSGDLEYLQRLHDVKMTIKQTIAYALSAVKIKHKADGIKELPNCSFVSVIENVCETAVKYKIVDAPGVEDRTSKFNIGISIRK